MTQTVRALASELCEDVRNHLLHEVMSFWRSHALDQDGGYHTNLDCQGTLIENEKNIWMQARQVWTFSTLYREVDADPFWKRLAEHGRDYLISSKAYAGNGRWNYLLDPVSGEVISGSVSIYTDCFCMMALSACASIGEKRDLALIEATFEALEKNLFNPDFKDVFPQKWQPDTAIHGIYMIALNAAAESVPVLGFERVAPFMNRCIDVLFDVIWDADAQALLECKRWNGQRLPAPAGTALNPGHNFEAAWFLMREAPKLGRQREAQKAAELVKRVWALAKDPQGGVFYMLDSEGKTPGPCDWHPVRALRWDEKVWWTHAEALCALMFAARQTSSSELMREFSDLWRYCLTKFADFENGEWYFALHRNGLPRLTQKGGLQKAAFHIPRSLIQCYLLLKEMSEE